jgi:PAS domain S-box-containing protein
MNLYKIIGYPLFFVAALEIVLGIILLRHNPRRSPINKTVAVFSFFSSAFSLLTALMYVRASLGLNFLPFAKATWVGWLCIPPAFQFISYLENEKSRKARIIGLALYPLMSLILLISLLTNWIVAGPYTLIPFIYNPGFLDTPARILDGSLILWLIVEIYLLRKKVSGMKKAQLDYFFYGTLVFAIGGSIIGAFLQVFGWGKFDPTLSSYFSFPWVLLTFYAITRYRLFDIPLMVSKVISIVLLLSLFEGIHLGLDKILGPTLGDLPADLISLTLIGLVLIATPLAQTIIVWINALVLRSRYDYQRILKDSTQAIITILDLDLLLNTIIDSIKKSLKVMTVHLFLMNDTDRRTPLQDESISTVTRNNEIMLQLGKVRQIVIREELEGASGTEEPGRLYAAMVQIGAEIIIPLIYKGKIQGILALGPKGNGSPYVKSDVDLLQTLAGQAALAIENAALYEEARLVKESLKESEQKFRTLAETIKAGIVIYRDDKFLYVNPAIESITGYTRAEFPMLNFSNIIHPDNLDLVRQRAIARLKGEPVPSQYEFKIVRKNGQERWLLATAGRINFGGERVTIAALLDITEHKQADEERTRLNEENVRQYRERIEEEKRHQQEKEKILMDIHDGIGGITTNISLLSEVARKAQSPEDVDRALATIANLSREGLGEIRSLMHSLDSKDLSWHTCVAELRNQGMSIVKAHKISFDMTSQIDDTSGDPGSILYLNLFRIYREALTNIIKHSQATRVVVGFRVGSGNLTLTVQDNGRGRDHSATLNRGRGLTNMKNRALEIGGTVTVSTDEGTCVCVTVPFPTKSATGPVDISEKAHK